MPTAICRSRPPLATIRPMAEDLTTSLRRLSEGDPDALERVVRLLYADLRDLAGRRIRGERADHTLGATGLVNEAYLRLRRQRRIGAESRTQFLSAAAATMRRVLVDYARQRQRRKRGGDLERLSLDEAEPLLAPREADELLALEGALERLTEANARAAQIVEQRFFAGLTVEEIAALHSVSDRTIRREWRAARAWLRKEITHELEWPA